MWFTDSDKVMWTLVVCTFINILGFTFMDENFWRFIIALAAAVFALFIKHFYDRNQKKKRLAKIEKAFTDILSTSILKCLNGIGEYAFNMNKNFDNKDSIFDFPPVDSININLLTLFDKTDLIDILTNRNIGINILYDINTSINMIYLENPRKIITDHKNLINDIISNDNKAIVELKEELVADSEYLSDFLKFSQKNKIDTYNTTKKKFEVCATNCSNTIRDIKSLLSNF